MPWPPSQRIATAAPGKLKPSIFLQSAFAAGPVLAGDIKRQASEAGITAKALRMAKDALGIKPEKTGMQGGWLWTLPKMPSDHEDAPVPIRAPST
jgi:hypothetical protein